MPTAAGWFGGGEDADDFGATKYLILGTVTVLLTVIGYVVFTGLLVSLSVLIGMVVGTVVALCMGLTDFSGVADADWIGISAPLHFGSSQFSLSPVLVMTLALIVIMAETTGNSLAIGRMIKAPITQRRLSDTFRGEGFAAVVSGFFNGFPLNAFSQNTGLIAMTKVRSRFVVTVAGVIMVLMGLVPKLGVIAAIPPSVLGGSAIIMFGMTTAAGIQELARVKYEGTNNALIVAVSLSVGVLPMASPELFGHFSGTARLVLDSGFSLRDLRGGPQSHPQPKEHRQ